MERIKAFGMRVNGRNAGLTSDILLNEFWIGLDDSFSETSWLNMCTCLWRTRLLIEPVLLFFEIQIMQQDLWEDGWPVRITKLLSIICYYFLLGLVQHCVKQAILLTLDASHLNNDSMWKRKPIMMIIENQ